MVKYSLYIKLGSLGKLAHPLWKGVMLMTTYETISLMIAFGMLIAMLSKRDK
ncbi:putative holin-like toxin [Bacillus haynesii]|uniref:putative holin-like toxin n=1 Tax=Bacillus haynesii TaxID=1925021 RepID=UPI002E141F9C